MTHEKVRGPHHAARVYLRFLFGVLALAIIPLLVNVVVDPLWYFAGNQLGPNYPFNERISKANLLAGSELDYDCLVLGSSRTTLLNVDEIQGRRCFNFAVSQARFSDALALARYSQQRKLAAKSVIFALDGFNYSQALSHFQNPLPPFLLVGKSPPHVLTTYLSADAMAFSWKTLRHQAPNDRYYDSQFSALALPGAGPFRPQRPLRAGSVVEVDRGFNQFSLGPFRYDPELSQLRKLFPDAELIGYVPPVAAQYLAHLHLAGTLESYLRALFESNRVFDRIYDFSIPSSVTRDANNTYDGSHFYAPANQMVARAVGDPPMPPYEAVELHQISFDSYQKRVQAAVLDYIHEVGVAQPAR